MQQYFLSMYQRDGTELPPPSVLESIMRDVNALRREMQQADAWVFRRCTRAGWKARASHYDTDRGAHVCKGDDMRLVALEAVLLAL